MWNRQDTIDLGRTVIQKRRYYLDTKYWIYLMEVERGNGTNVQKEIYDILLSLSEDGKAICPISYHSFVELQKQTDRGSLLATAKLMDRLSSKICFIPLDGIFQQELICYIRSKQFEKSGFQPITSLKYVWTKIPYLFGDFDFELPDVPKEESTIVLKQFRSFWTDLGLYDLLKRYPNRMPQISHKRIVEHLNEGKDLNQNWNTFDQICLIELTGTLGAFEEEAMEILHELSQSNEKDEPQSYSALLSMIISEWKEKKIVAGLPCISIGTLLHSYFRYNKSQRFKENDLDDFGHAAWAIPYCDAFFTREARVAEKLGCCFLALDFAHNSDGCSLWS